MIEYKGVFTIRAPIEMVMEVDAEVAKGEFPNRSQAWISLTKAGLLFHKIKPNIDDPQFKKSMEKHKQDNTLLDFLKTLDPSQLQGYADAIAYEKERIEKERN